MIMTTWYWLMNVARVQKLGQRTLPAKMFKDRC